jgi:hypothetical protein
MTESQKISFTLAKIGLILLLLTTGCSPKETQEVDTPPTDTLMETAEVDTGPGFEEGELPEKFPNDFPLPDETRIGTSVNVGNGAFRTYLSLQGTLDEAISFYQMELPTAGWSITEESENQGNQKMDLIGQEYHGELTFISGEEGVVLEVFLFPPDYALDKPDIPENMGESTTLGDGESDFPEDFPLPASFLPVQVGDLLADQGYQLAFSYQGMPELALADMTMAFILEDWMVGDPTVEGNRRAYIVPFENPETGFKGFALISNDPEIVAVENQETTIIAYQTEE